MNRLILVLVITSFFISCKKEVPPPIYPSEQKLLNLSYGNDVRNKVDVYLPAYRTSVTPFILLIHGGRWNSGEKTFWIPMHNYLLEKGIASGSMNFRYASGTVHYPELMEDVGAAMEFCKSKSEEWGVGDKYLIGGSSAGAHMALLYAYKYDLNGLVSGVISLWGLTDFTDKTFTDHSVTSGLMTEIELMAGRPYTTPLDNAFIEISPARAIKNVPTLMIHGDSDPLVFYSQSLRLDSALQHYGILRKFVTLPNTDHSLCWFDPINFRIDCKEVEYWTKLIGK